MAIARGNLYFGQLASSKADIYSPSSVDGMVHLITLHNTNTSAETVELLYHDGANEYTFFKSDLSANETVFLTFGNEGFYVEDAGKITGNTTTASKVTIKIDGSTEA